MDCRSRHFRDARASQRSGRMTREFYIEGAGVTRVESVLAQGLAATYSQNRSPFGSCRGTTPRV